MSRYQRILDKLYTHSIDHFIHYRRHFKEYAWAIVIALFLRATVLTIYKIPTGSMIPTFRVGDVLLANRFYYGLKVPFTDGLSGYRFRLPGLYKEPRVGDVIIFRAPPEDIFYQVRARVQSPEGANLIREMNLTSSFKRPISLEAGETNYTRIASHSDEDVLLILHHSVYDRYKDRLETSESLDVEIQGRYPLYMTYREHRYRGFWQSLLDTPIAGISILANVVIDTPFCLLPKALGIFSMERFAEPLNRQGYLRRFMEFRLYPNRYVDTTKDFVKRVVAGAGDKVEIKNKILYINDVPRAMTPAHTEEGEYDGYPAIYDVFRTRFSIHGPEGDEEVVHPVRLLQSKSRFSPRLIVPRDAFDSRLWPFDPNFFFSRQYRDNFGPIVVPPNHYFVLGDNRDQSLDGRFWGCVPTWAIKGTPMVKLYPRIGLIQ